MKRTVLAVALMGLVSSPVLAKDMTKLENEADKLGYTIGADLGENLKAQNISVNADAVAQGVKDALTNTEFLLSQDERRLALQNLQKSLAAKRAAEIKVLADKNKAQGDSFLAANKDKEGVVTLDSGLQYKVIEAGNGVKPTTEDSVTVEYEGKLLNGNVFDSSKKVETPVSFKLTQVIPGWTEVLQLMPEGAKWEVYIPAELAYGAHGIGSIGPNETLVFNIHLIKVEPADKQS